jgi:hypothetical protein
MGKTPVVVGQPRRYVDRGQVAVSSSIEADGRRLEIFYRFSQGSLSDRSDAFLAAALLPAMRLGVPLRVQGAVSSRLLENLPIFQDIICTWYKDFHRVTIDAEAAHETTTIQPRSGVACFFSAGVDSFYSALKHQSELTHLILVHGFDFGLGQETLPIHIAQSVYKAAAELGKPLVEVETNLRTLVDLYGDWNYHLHGTALASVALAQDQLKKVYIASAHSYDRLKPLGSHPLLNPLWSTEQMQVIHDGCEANRYEKMHSIMNNETVRRWLRVCWLNSGDAYNCGHCSKCLRTMVFIHFVGLQKEFITFPPELDRAEMAKAAVDPSNLSYMEQFVAYADSHDGNQDIADVVRDALGHAAPPAGSAAGDRAEKLARRVAALDGDLQRITTSRSWQLTAPLRVAGNLLERVKEAISR